MKKVRLFLVVMVAVAMVSFMPGYAFAKSCNNHECGQCGNEECVECPDLVCPDIPDCICNGTECPDVTCPKIPECPPDPDCNCPSCPDCLCPQEGECPDLVCPEIPDCVCNAPECPDCPDCVCNEDEDGGVSVYHMFGIGGGGIDPRIMLGTLSIYKGKNERLGIAMQCLITGDLTGGVCAGYFLVESH